MNNNNSFFPDGKKEHGAEPMRETEQRTASECAETIKKRGTADKNKNGKKKTGLYIVVTLILCACFFFLGWFLSKTAAGKKVTNKVKDIISEATDSDPAWNKPEYVSYEPIVKNTYSRPCTILPEINGIVVHYVANPGTTAAQNRSYFNGLADSGATYASSHFIIGLDGEVIQLIPLNEVAYCSNNRNDDTVSIECCHPEEDGKFTDKTYKSLIKLLKDLCKEYDLDPLEDVIRHYDITGKMCPIYYVENPDEWDALRAEVAGVKAEKVKESTSETGWDTPDYVTYDPLVKNEFSRPGTKLEKVKCVVLHYVANPGTTAAQNRKYYNGLADSGSAKTSSHFIVDTDGTVLQIIPLNEISLGSDKRNSDGISVQCCHPDEDGKFTDETYDSVVKLLADLCKEYGLDPMKDIIRHFDINGNPCPLYFVDHVDKWDELRADVAAAMTDAKKK